MNKIDFCEVMGDINEEYIEAAQLCREDNEVKAKAKRKLSVALIAACVCLVISATTAMAASGFGTQIIELFTDRSQGPDYSESGYELSVLIEKIPVSELKGDVKKVGKLIVQQYKEYQPHFSWFPGLWQKTFSSRDEAIEYVGFEGLKKLDLDVTEKETKLNVYGDADGAIQSLYIETTYTEGDIRLQFYSSIYTENCTEEITTGSYTTETVVFTESFYTTENNKRCHIIEGSDMESGYMTINGYLVESGVLYKLHIAYLEKDAARAKELLHQWADLF